MEGLTGATFRRLHAQYFGGVNRYFIPFITPTVQPRFTDRQLRELLPQINGNACCVPQLLTRRAEDFLWAARALYDMGYPEVNLNIGCPAGTVVAKGKGAGFLREPFVLEAFLERIFDEGLPIAISVKTRLGWSSEDEFDRLCTIFNRFPIACLTIHPRLKIDLYKGHIREHVFSRLAPTLNMPLGFNGDLVTNTDITNCRLRYPKLKQIMVGRALIADPAIFRKVRGGQPASREEIAAWTDVLLDAHADLWGSRKNALMRMKEYWFLLANLFENSEKITKKIFKAKNESDYQEARKELLDQPIRPQARFGWYKALS